MIWQDFQLHTYIAAHGYSTISAYWSLLGRARASPTLLSSMHPRYMCVSSICTTSDKVCMHKMFHVEHGIDAPPTTCMRSPKRKWPWNRWFATATDINGCSVARSIEVTMVGTARSIEITMQGQLSWRLKSRVLMYAYTRRVSCTLCNNFQAASYRPRQTTERRLAPLYDKS